MPSENFPLLIPTLRLEFGKVPKIMRHPTTLGTHTVQTHEPAEQSQAHFERRQLPDTRAAVY